ncbi:uncharacterized protein [Gossypium hirsutum]|uniref:Uncharacterized protein n=1 Tax=Gossypium hirsutum TaxID=3635 RepID=A0ABM3BBZ4_GOSHI|nr:uncharacterized protein LOC121224987 [Gossypium hirsutum]
MSDFELITALNYHVVILVQYIFPYHRLWNSILAYDDIDACCSFYPFDENSFSPSLFSGQGPGQEPPCRPPVAGAGAAVHGGRETKSLSFFSPMPLLDLPNAPVTAKKAGSWANGRKQVNGGAGEKARGKDVRR